MRKSNAPQDNAVGSPYARAAALLTGLLLPATVLAHPGHGEGSFWPGLLHPFSGLDHLLAAVAVGVWAVRMGGRATWAIPLAFLAAMATGGTMGASGTPLPMTEASIAVSVLLLGVLVACDARVSLPLGIALVALIASFHGAVHAAEAPGLASPMSYIAALLLGTALLHIGGIGVALAARGRPLALRIAAAPVALAGLLMLVGRAA
jgi:urease accessory protein